MSLSLSDPHGLEALRANWAALAAKLAAAANPDEADDLDSQIGDLELQVLALGARYPQAPAPEALAAEPVLAERWASGQRRKLQDLGLMDAPFWTPPPSPATAWDPWKATTGRFVPSQHRPAPWQFCFNGSLSE